MNINIERLKIRKELESLAEKDYQKFSSALIPNVENVLGVRLPILRKLAQKVYSSQNFEWYLNDSETKYMEEVMLKGMIIGLCNADFETQLKYIKNFIPQINNWAVCDSFCCGLKCAIENQDTIWSFIQPYLKSEKEYEIRFAVVMILNFFVKKKYLLQIFNLLEKIKTDYYYAQMGIAWAISICYREYPKETYEYLRHSKLTTVIFNKTIQKCIESLKTDKKNKEKLRILKRES